MLKCNVLQENTELKVQLLRLQQVSEQQKATILLLQQQMVNSFNMLQIFLVLL